MKDESHPVFPTIVVLSVLISAYSWMIELLLFACHAFWGGLPGNNPVAHYILLTVACGSSLFVRFVGRHHFFARNGNANGCLHLTKIQALIVTLFAICYPCFVGWALGLFV